MSSSANTTSTAVLWQGFHHRWQYNHRANRMGSYIGYKAPSTAEVIHTGASGSGPDRLTFADRFARIRAAGVMFHHGVLRLKIQTLEDQLTDFNVRLEEVLDAEMAGHAQYAVVLNGFDLTADGDADKLMTLSLEATDPEPQKNSAMLAFNIKGAFRVDCRSPECDLQNQKLAKSSQMTWRDSVYLLDRELTTTSEVHREAPQAMVGVNIQAESPGRVDYILNVYYLIIAGSRESFHATASRLIEHDYKWDKSHEIFAEKEGQRPLHEGEAIVGEFKSEYGCYVFGLKQLVLNLQRETRRRRFLFWELDHAMHLLEFNFAIGAAEETQRGIFTCRLDLFFKNWAKGMNFTHIWQSLLAFKDAGEAQFGAQVMLLQFKDADLCDPLERTDSLTWPGGNKSAKNSEAAESRFTVSLG